jgi:hypothetical protein
MRTCACVHAHPWSTGAVVEAGRRRSTDRAVLLQCRKASKGSVAVPAGGRARQQLPPLGQEVLADVAVPLYSLLHVVDVQEGGRREAIPVLLVLHALQVLHLPLTSAHPPININNTAYNTSFACFSKSYFKLILFS